MLFFIGVITLIAGLLRDDGYLIVIGIVALLAAD
ncbi:hypothetical protein S144_67 [Shewanella sp. phage 1/44]|nr:hypothetical protein S144_67 [Shewanella sp. phage 1/44]AHK11781.1 hypothetical protein S144_67 [Shewanella sp. phage 1/44]